MARKKREFDKQEVEEIIQLKLSELNGIVKKLTYNSVYTLNKKIANNEEYKRSDGKLFNLYPYDFWAGAYKDEDNYGKKRITELKNTRARDLDDELFESGLQDILLAINDLHDNPTKLSKVLVNIFKKDRRKIEAIEKENTELKKGLKQQKEKIELLENTMYNLFYSSKSTRNSLANVMRLTKYDDWFVAEQLQNAFCDKQELLDALTKEESKAEVISITKSKKRKMLDKLNSLED